MKKTAATIIDETLTTGRSFTFQATWKQRGGWSKTRTFGEVRREGDVFIIEAAGKPTVRVEGDGAALCIVLCAMGMRTNEIHACATLNAEIYA